MAAIDKLYGTKEQWQELRDWFEEHSIYTNGLYLEEYILDAKSETFAISNFSMQTDLYLWLFCEIDWVKEQISEQYAIKDGDWRKAFGLHD